MKNEIYHRWWIRDGEENVNEKEEASVVLKVDEMLSSGFNFFTVYAFYKYQHKMNTMLLLRTAEKYSDIFPWLLDFLKDEIFKVEAEIRAEGNDWMLEEKRIYDYAN